MAVEITVTNNEEFEDLINNQDIGVANALVDTILKNLKGKKRYMHALSVNVIDDQSIYDITVDRNDFIPTLRDKLPIFEAHELYERCADILNAINFLTDQGKK